MLFVVCIFAVVEQNMEENFDIMFEMAFLTFNFEYFLKKIA